MIYADLKLIKNITGDGRQSLGELKADFLSNERNERAIERIKTADVLVIDEIGMVSNRTFTSLEMVCRIVKGNDQVFGGLQVNHSTLIHWHETNKWVDCGLWYYMQARFGLHPPCKYHLPISSHQFDYLVNTPASVQTI